MKEQIINQIAPIITTLIITLLVVIIKNLGDKAVEYISQKTANNKHQDVINTAKEIWNIVEETFRTDSKVQQVFKNKADYFNQLLLEKVPGLTQSEINYLRQSIAGEINKGKAALTQEEVNITDLQKENADLKSQLEKIQNVIVPKSEIGRASCRERV